MSNHLTKTVQRKHDCKHDRGAGEKSPDRKKHHSSVAKKDLKEVIPSYVGVGTTVPLPDPSPSSTQMDVHLLLNVKFKTLSISPSPGT